MEVVQRFLLQSGVGENLGYPFMHSSLSKRRKSIEGCPDLNLIITHGAFEKSH